MALPLLGKTNEWSETEPPQTAAPDATQLGLMLVWAVAVIELGLGDGGWHISSPTGDAN